VQNIVPPKDRSLVALFHLILSLEHRRKTHSVYVFATRADRIESAIFIADSMIASSQTSKVLSRFQSSDEIPIPRNKSVERLASISNASLSTHEDRSKMQMRKELAYFENKLCFAHFRFNPLKSATFRQFSLDRLSRLSIQFSHFLPFCG
jgi:hypothetical protein